MSEMNKRELLNAILAAVQALDTKVTSINDRLATTHRDTKHIKRKLNHLAEEVYDTMDRLDELEKQ